MHNLCTEKGPHPRPGLSWGRASVEVEGLLGDQASAGLIQWVLALKDAEDLACASLSGLGLSSLRSGRDLGLADDHRRQSGKALTGLAT